MKYILILQNLLLKDIMTSEGVELKWYKKNNKSLSDIDNKGKINKNISKNLKKIIF